MTRRSKRATLDDETRISEGSRAGSAMTTWAQRW